MATDPEAQLRLGQLHIVLSKLLPYNAEWIEQYIAEQVDAAEAAAREPLEQEITRLKGHRSESACVSGSHLYDWLRDESRLAPTRIDIINLFEDVERDAHARGVAEAREEDCKALCVFCEGGIEVHPPPMQDTWRKLPCWWHKTGSDGLPTRCAASPIRALSAPSCSGDCGREVDEDGRQIHEPGCAMGREKG